MSDFLFLMTPESLQAFVYIVIILTVLYFIMWVILKIVARFKKTPADVKKAQGLNLTLSSGADLATTSGLLSIDDNGNIFSMGFPKGMIIMWKPQSANLTPPVGWAVCDGNTPGVPNLTNKFIRGGTGTDATASVITGGADTVKLDLKHLPNHTHSLVDGKNPIKRMTISSGNGANSNLRLEYKPTPDWLLDQVKLWSDYDIINANSTSDVVQTQGMSGVVNESLSILPSYYTLAYLMKL
jgi:hypothetical protein